MAPTGTGVGKRKRKRTPTGTGVGKRKPPPTPTSPRGNTSPLRAPSRQVATSGPHTAAQKANPDEKGALNDDSSGKAVEQSNVARAPEHKDRGEGYASLSKEDQKTFRIMLDNKEIYLENIGIVNPSQRVRMTRALNKGGLKAAVEFAMKTDTDRQRIHQAIDFMYAFIVREDNVYNTLKEVCDVELDPEGEAQDNRNKIDVFIKDIITHKVRFIQAVSKMQEKPSAESVGKAKKLLDDCEDPYSAEGDAQNLSNCISDLRASLGMDTKKSPGDTS